MISPNWIEIQDCNNLIAGYLDRALRGNDRLAEKICVETYRKRAALCGWNLAQMHQRDVTEELRRRYDRDYLPPRTGGSDRGGLPA